MLRCSAKPVIFLMIASFLLLDFSICTARAELIATETAVAVRQQASNRERVIQFFNRQDVQQAMTRQGVDPEEARQRVASLSDAEVQRIAAAMDKLPAGGDGVGTVIGAAVFIFLVLLITDLLGLTDVFPFVRR